MELKIGQAVKFMDPKRRERDALVTYIHMGGEYDDIEQFKVKYGTYPLINLIAVMCEEERKDPYGTQTEHFTSVAFQNPVNDVAGGFYYRFLLAEDIL